MHPLYTLLLAIKNNPKAYLGTTSLYRLYYFILGYQECLFLKNRAEEYEFLLNFPAFVSDEWDFHRPVHWTKHLTIAAQSDQKAFFLFYKELEKYLQQYPIKLLSEPTPPPEGGSPVNPFYELLLTIKEKPGLYLGTVSAKRLYHFIQGYQTCLRIHHMEDETAFFHAFQGFVQENYGANINLGWAYLIDFHCGSDEEAFYIFYELFDTYMKCFDRNKAVGQA